jgi:hypothetical protein
VLCDHVYLLQRRPPTTDCAVYYTHNTQPGMPERGAVSGVVRRWREGDGTRYAYTIIYVYDVYTVPTIIIMIRN